MSNDPDSYWKRVAVRYRSERDLLFEENLILRKTLLEKTGRAHDGEDYLREIAETKTSPTLRQRLKHLSERILGGTSR